MCFPSSNTRPSGHQGVGQQLSKDNPNCSRLAEHALILGSRKPISSNSTVFGQAREPTDSTVQ